MSNQLDQLFKNKLSGHAVPPPVQAWEKVSAGLGKKNNRPFVLRIAAGVVLAAALTAVIFWLTSNRSINSATTISQQTKRKLAAPATIPAPATVADTKARPVVTKKKKQWVDKKSPGIEKSRVVPPVAETRTQEVTAMVDINPPVETPVIVIKEEKPIVLEYRLTPVTHSPVIAASPDQEVKPKSGLSKVIDFALEAKNGDSHLGDLRQAKDELFALNFKKDKQNTQK